jgi:hypothetical protein
MPRAKVDLNDPTSYTTCGICGAKLRTVPGPHCKTHGLTLAEYRSQFDNTEFHFLSEQNRVKRSVGRTKQNNERYADPGFMEYWREKKRADSLKLHAEQPGLIGWTKSWENPQFVEDFKKQHKEMAADPTNRFGSWAKRWAEPEYADMMMHLERSSTKFQTGFYETQKGGRAYHRSSFELRLFKLLDRWPAVKSYKHEPFWFEFLDEGRVRRYMPDFQIAWNYQSKDTIVEMKPLRFVEDSLVVIKAAAAVSYCESRNLEYEIWTEEHLEGLEFMFDKLDFDSPEMYLAQGRDRESDPHAPAGPEKGT